MEGQCSRDSIISHTLPELGMLLYTEESIYRHSRIRLLLAGSTSPHFSTFLKPERWYPSRKQGAGLSARITRATSPRAGHWRATALTPLGDSYEPPSPGGGLFPPPGTFRQPCSSNGSMVVHKPLRRCLVSDWARTGPTLPTGSVRLCPNKAPPPPRTTNEKGPKQTPTKNIIK
jgi:hypothetical protein